MMCVRRTLRIVRRRVYCPSRTYRSRYSGVVWRRWWGGRSSTRGCSGRRASMMCVRNPNDTNRLCGSNADTSSLRIDDRRQYETPYVEFTTLVQVRILDISLYDVADRSFGGFDDFLEVVHHWWFELSKIPSMPLPLLVFSAGLTIQTELGT